MARFRALITLAERTWVWFPSPTGCLITTHNRCSRGSSVLFWPPRVPGVHMVHRHTSKQNTHAYKINLRPTKSLLNRILKNRYMNSGWFLRHRDMTTVDKTKTGQSEAWKDSNAGHKGMKMCVLTVNKVCDLCCETVGKLQGSSEEGVWLKLSHMHFGLRLLHHCSHLVCCPCKNEGCLWTAVFRLFCELCQHS